MADYDLPSTVDFIRSKTGKEKIGYVGHSQGTSIMFAQLSENPEFIDKISVFIALAPVASISKMNVPLISFAVDTNVLGLLEFFHVYDFLAPLGHEALVYSICNFYGHPCADLLWMIADMKLSEDNLDRLPVVMTHFPSGTSLQDFAYFQQMFKKQEFIFQKFDYGAAANMQVYHQPTPPVYNLTNAPGPIAIFAGQEDRLANTADVAWLVSQLNPESIVYKNQTLPLGHGSFIWGEYMSYFDKAVELLKQYTV